MEKYIISLNNTLSVLGLYIIMSVPLNFNTNFQNIKLEKKMYIIKNVVKSLVLLYVGIFSTIDFIHFIYNDEFKMNAVYDYASFYVANDFIALLIVPNLPQTTKLHHQITCLFLVYTLHVDFNSIQNVGQLLFIYTIFSSYAFLVNFYLGIRFLKNKNDSHLNKIIDYSKRYAYYIYIVSCIINWIIHIVLLSYRAYLGVFNLHYILYSGLLYFIIKDDLILMSWLKN
jgi:hypothetical protein